MDLESLDTALADVYRRRGRWILVSEVAVAATSAVETMRRWGLEHMLLVSATEGVGEAPEGLPIVFTRTSGDTIMEGLRAFDGALEQPESDLYEAVVDFDPSAEAGVLIPPMGTRFDFVGRPVYGARRDRWIALEDKTVVDELWDAAGVTRVPSAVVPLSQAAEVAGGLASPLGTVWAADNTEGWHGGGEYLRWVSEPDTTDAAVEWFRPRARTVRVMPFLDGIPCSIHGYVTGDGVATFRPVEMVIARRTDRSGFFYMGMASVWDPSDEIRSEMRRAARRVGEVLDERVAYRGGFSIDGVATLDGFRPTELNPRLSAGLGMLASTVEGLQLGFATRALVENDVDLPAGWVEATITERADQKRVAGMGVSVPAVVDAASLPVRVVSGELVRAEVDDEEAGSLEIGPSVSGSRVQMRLDAATLPKGRAMAPYAIAAIRLAAEEWGFEIPDIEPAPDVLRDG